MASRGFRYFGTQLVINQSKSASMSPAVRRLILMHSLDPHKISATGKQGRFLTKSDVLEFLKTEISGSSAPVAKQSSSTSATPSQSPQQQLAKPQPTVAPVPSLRPRTTSSVSPPAPQSGFTDIHLNNPGGTYTALIPEPSSGFTDTDLSNMRKTIAKRLVQSKQSIPHFYASIDVTMDRLMGLRRELAEDSIKVSVNDFIIKAAASSLKQVPEMNAQWTAANGVQLVSDIDVSVAVATPNGLITPIVRNAVGMGLLDISGTVRELAVRAREGKLKPEEYQGGSFTISNLGMFGIMEFTAIINPPQAAIMAVGRSRVVVSEGAGARTVMTVQLSSDARVVNYRLATRFLEAFKANLEQPIRMGLL